MKVIIFRNKYTNEIETENDLYAKYIAEGKTEEEIVAMVEKHNSNENFSKYAEIIELDEVSEFFRERNLDSNKWKMEQLHYLRNTFRALMASVDVYIEETEKEIEKENKDVL